MALMPEFSPNVNPYRKLKTHLLGRIEIEIDSRLGFIGSNTKANLRHPFKLRYNSEIDKECLQLEDIHILDRIGEIVSNGGRRAEVILPKTRDGSKEVHGG